MVTLAEVIRSNFEWTVGLQIVGEFVHVYFYVNPHDRGFFFIEPNERYALVENILATRMILGLHVPYPV